MVRTNVFENLEVKKEVGSKKKEFADHLEIDKLFNSLFTRFFDKQRFFQHCLSVV